MYRHFLFNLFLSRLDLGPVFCGNFIAGPGRRIGFNYLPHSGILRYLLAGNLAEAAFFVFFISGEVDSGSRSSGRLKHNALLAMSNISGEVDSGLLKIKNTRIHLHGSVCSYSLNPSGILQQVTIKLHDENYRAVS